ncbi:prostaglandin E receptor 2b subtype EP2 isoform X3 [Gadus chalcogrammus]|uniref:prostaglandin E receptor 2b subtype EP2 isoform X3 n=1 Tax=Gadus chalcogrammus TaxID=1042646 RepID=UPI0024C4BA64|nr:prostaglandin E receptor 2b subtype EP2 isoform X3 [Gadus chalcogrammus]
MPANSTDCHETLTLESGLPTMSAVMFALGVAGNFVALALLETRRRTNSPSLFRILVTALITTDLLGTIAVTPFVLVAYAKNTTLVAQGDRGVLCSYFGFSMTFLSLSTLSILCAMALERFIALGFPYFYDRHITSTRCGYVAIALIYLACVLFCACPLMGFGKYVQYCPGTWCFLDMSPHSDSDKIYTAFYACFTLIVIMCTSVCNLSVIHFLVKMHRRRNTHHRAGRSLSRRFFRRSLSMMEEVEHILPLIFITVAFSICSFPILLRVFINFIGRTEEQQASDLHALRMLSFNSIIDPWVFIFLEPSVLKFVWRNLCRRQGKPHNPKSPVQPRLQITTTTTTTISSPTTTGVSLQSCGDLDGSS